MRHSTEDIPCDRSGDVRAQIRACKRFRALTDEWARLSIERCRLLAVRPTVRPSRPRR